MNSFRRQNPRVDINIPIKIKLNDLLTVSGNTITASSFGANIRLHNETDYETLNQLFSNTSNLQVQVSTPLNDLNAQITAVFTKKKQLFGELEIARWTLVV